MDNMDQDTPVAESRNRLTDWMYHPTAVALGGVAGQGLKLCLVAAFTIGIYKVFFEPRVVAVDLTKVINGEIERAAQRGQSDAERAANADRFGQALEAALSEVSDGGRNVVLVAPAVVRGADDRTAAVLAAVRAAMDAKNVAAR